MSNLANNSGLKYSVILLLEDFNEDLAEYVTSVDRIFDANGELYEILIFSNGTENLLRRNIELLGSNKGEIRGFAFNKKTSQAVCIKAAVNECKGKVVVVCGSYMQIDENSFVNLLESFNEDTDIICPWRQNRVDPWLNKIQSKFFNWIVRVITKSDLHDLSCTVKVFKREVIENIELYGNMFRFLPIVASQRGYKYKEIVCNHFKERGPTGLYVISEYLERVLDIFTLYFVTGFSRKPLRFFNVIGSAFFAGGAIAFLFVMAQRLIFDYKIGQRSVLLTSILLMVLGVQAVGVGLLGEIITFTFGRLKPAYSIEKFVNGSSIQSNKTKTVKFKTINREKPSSLTCK